MNILLYIQEKENLSPRSQELLNISSFWKSKKQGKLIIALDTKKNEVLENQLKEWEIDKLFYFGKDEKSLDKLYSLFQEVMQKEKIDCIVMGNNIHERELAPFLAANLDWDFIPNITDFEFKDNEIIWKRFLYGTRAIEESKTKAQSIVITISANIYKKDERTKIKNLITEIVSSKEENKFSYVIKESEEKIVQKHPLEIAKIVIGIGKGINGASNFLMVEELADLIGATIGVTRAVVDNGWRPEYEKIGQTGKIIKPELYLGFGISGAMQHMAGVQQARHIIMVNSNPNAESFYSCDLGIVTDLFEVIPQMIEALKK